MIVIMITMSKPKFYDTAYYNESSAMQTCWEMSFCFIFVMMTRCGSFNKWSTLIKSTTTSLRSRFRDPHDQSRLHYRRCSKTWWLIESELKRIFAVYVETITLNYCMPHARKLVFRKNYEYLQCRVQMKFLKHPSKNIMVSRILKIFIWNNYNTFRENSNK